MIWCEKDACQCHRPECAEHGCMDRTGGCADAVIDWKARALSAEADLTEFRRSFDGHVYVKDEEYAAFHARLRKAESDRDEYRKLWIEAVAPRRDVGTGKES